MPAHRRMLILALALSLVASFAMTTQASAAGSAARTSAQAAMEPNFDAEVIVHLRDCPTGATDVFNQCHPYGVAGVGVNLVHAADSSVLSAGITDAEGNVALPGFAGEWMLWVMIDEGTPIVGAWCSYGDHLGTETYIDLSMALMLTSGDSVYCDIYITTGSNKVDDGGTKLPDTGIGPAAVTGGIGSSLALLAAAASMAAVTRRRRTA